MSEAKAMTVAGLLDARLRAQAPEYMDPFNDETPVAQTCNTEHPEKCEACD